MELEDTVYGKFAPRGFNGTWVSGNEVRVLSGVYRVTLSLVYLGWVDLDLWSSFGYRVTHHLKVLLLSKAPLASSNICPQAMELP